MEWSGNESEEKVGLESGVTPLLAVVVCGPQRKERKFVLGSNF